MLTACGLFWEAKSWRFMGWYINMQSPFFRTSIGFDATDDILDVWIEPDGTWAWKDSDELDEAVRTGACNAQAARAIRREAAQAIEAIPGREPFTDTWTTWRPDPDWPVPEWSQLGSRHLLHRRVSVRNRRATAAPSKRGRGAEYPSKGEQYFRRNLHRAQQGRAEKDNNRGGSAKRGVEVARP